MAKIDLNDKHIKRLVTDIKNKCKKKKVAFRLIKSNNISCNGSFISGYFDNNNLELVVAQYNRSALEVLIHESGHLDQWTEDHKALTGTDFPYKSNVLESHYLFDLWLNGTIEMEHHILEKMVHRMMDCERDCEKRTIKKIKKYHLENLINIDEYCQKANAYILGYKSILEHRSWFAKNKSPYYIPEVYGMFPTKISSSTETTPIMRKLINEYCFDK